MQAPTTSFYDWQQRFATEQACLDAIAAQRWPEGFRCPHCGHDHGWLYAARHRYECARCYRQTYITSGTALHGSRVALTKCGFNPSTQHSNLDDESQECCR
jgi:transposase-like protein